MAGVLIEMNTVDGKVREFVRLNYGLPPEFVKIVSVKDTKNEQNGREYFYVKVKIKHFNGRCQFFSLDIDKKTGAILFKP